MEVFWIVLISILVFCLLVSFLLYLIIFFRGKKKTPAPEPIRGKDFDPYAEQMREVIKKAVAIPFEEVTVRSHDGISLYGRLYVTRPGRPFHLQFNGYRSTGIRDFAGGLRMALDLGDNVLLVDQRAHGQSGGHTISFGVRERFDVLTWCRFILERYGLGTPLYVEGISMGGATVLFAAGEDLPPEVRGIFADCPFSDPAEIISDVMRKLIGFSRPLMPFVSLGALLFGHFRLSSVRATDTVKRTPVPIQIVHGTADNFVPCSMSRDVRDANPEDVSLFEVEGAPHGLSFLVDAEGYRRTFLSFLESAGHPDVSVKSAPPKKPSVWASTSGQSERSTNPTAEKESST